MFFYFSNLNQSKYRDTARVGALVADSPIEASDKLIELVKELLDYADNVSFFRVEKVYYEGTNNGRISIIWGESVIDISGEETIEEIPFRDSYEFIEREEGSFSITLSRVAIN